MGHEYVRNPQEKDCSKIPGVPTTVTYSGYNCNKDDRLWGEDLTAAAANSMMTEKIRRSNTVRNLSRQESIIKSRCDGKNHNSITKHYILETLLC